MTFYRVCGQKYERIKQRAKMELFPKKINEPCIIIVKEEADREAEKHHY